MKAYIYQVYLDEAYKMVINEEYINYAIRTRVIFSDGNCSYRTQNMKYCQNGSPSCFAYNYIVFGFGEPLRGKKFNSYESCKKAADKFDIKEGNVSELVAVLDV